LENPSQKWRLSEKGKLRNQYNFQKKEREYLKEKFNEIQRNNNNKI
jgi:hypothetical protein